MKKAWYVTVVSILFAVVFAMSTFKVSATTVLIMEDFEATLTTIGLLTSVPGLALAICTLPSGVLMQRIGPKRILLLAALIGSIGCIIGALSSNIPVLLLGRILEGVSFGIANMAVPNIITMWFPPQKRGLPNSIFSLWVSFGMLTIFLISSLIAPSFGWRGVWWLNLILFAAIGVLFGLSVKAPSSSFEGGAADSSAAPKVSILEGFKAPGAWMLALVFLAYTIIFSAFTYFYPTFLIQGLSMGLTEANGLFNFATIGMIAGGLLMGVILNKVKRGHYGMLLITSTVFLSVAAFSQFQLANASIPIMLVLGFVYQLLPPIIFTLAPDMANRPETIAPTISIITFGSSLGSILGPVVTGLVVESAQGNWASLSLPLLVIAAVCVASAVAVQIIRSRKLKRTDV